MSFFNFFGIFLGCMTLNIECLYITMALKVHWSQYNAILPLKNDDLFVAVDMITVYVTICPIVDFIDTLWNKTRHGTHVCMTTFLMIHQLMSTSSSWSSDFDLTIMTMTIADADMHIQLTEYCIPSLLWIAMLWLLLDDDQRGNCWVVAGVMWPSGGTLPAAI